MRPLLVAFGLLAAAASAFADVPEPGRLADPVPTLAVPQETAAVYLPTRWRADGKHPLLLVFDPRSRGALAAEIFRPAAEKHGWVIVSSNSTRSDGPWEPNLAAVNALWPDAMQRYAIDPERIYATGFSGGAILAWVVGQQTGKLAGVLSVGGRLPPELDTERVRFAHFGAAGKRDFNFLETWEMERLAGDRGVPHRIEIFDGAHQWLDSALAARAIEWFEIVAMKSGSRPKDGALIAEALERERLEAEAAMSRGDQFEASIRYTMIARTFEGIADVGPIAMKAKELDRSPQVRKARAEAKKWERWEKVRIRELARAIPTLRGAEIPLTAGRISAVLGLPRLLAAAEKPGEGGDAAARVLSSIFAQTSFYLPQEAEEAGRPDEVAAWLEAARLIQAPAFLDYNLACAYARARRTEAAFEMLESAISKGFRDAAHLAADPDLESLRDDPRFAALLGRLRSVE